MEEITKIEDTAIKELEQIQDKENLNNFYQKYLGKTGKISELMKNIKDVVADKRKEFGMTINSIKQKIQEKIAKKEEEFERLKIQRQIDSCMLSICL